MRHPPNATVILLLASAVLLGALFFSLDHLPVAQAESSTRGGDYIMVTGGLDEDTDLLYIVDVKAQRLNTYYLDDDSRSKQIRRLTTLDLKRVFTAAE
jgi:hypothetical protein